MYHTNTKNEFTKISRIDRPNISLCLCTHAYRSLLLCFDNLFLYCLEQAEMRRQDDNETEIAASDKADCEANVEQERPWIQIGEFLWVTWGEGMRGQVVAYIRLEQQERLIVTPNPYYCPPLIDKFFDDLKLFGVWGCSKRREFKRGSIPASSGKTEAAIKVLKIDYLDRNRPPQPLHETVKSNVDYIKGKTNLAQAALLRKEAQLSSNGLASSNEGTEKFTELKSTTF